MSSSLRHSAMHLVFSERSFSVSKKRDATIIGIGLDKRYRFITTFKEVNIPININKSKKNPSNLPDSPSSRVDPGISLVELHATVQCCRWPDFFTLYSVRLWHFLVSPTPSTGWKMADRQSMCITWTVLDYLGVPYSTHRLPLASR